MMNQTHIPQGNMALRKIPEQSPETTFGGKISETTKTELDKFARSIGSNLSAVLRDGAMMFKDGYLPVLGAIPCGPIEEATQHTPYYEIAPPVLKPRADLGDYLLEASGDSMAPNITNKDYVMLRPNIDWSNGEICAVQVYENDDLTGPCQATLKRVYVDRTRAVATLKADNPAYPDIEVPLQRMRVVGVKRGLIRRDGS